MENQKVGPLIQNLFKNYIKRSGTPSEPLITPPIKPNCKLSVVIPCFNEPDLISSLNAITSNDLDSDIYEVIVVVNHSEQASDAQRGQNKKTLSDSFEWLKSTRIDSVHLIQSFDLPHKHAGVGLARKIGMDEASRRFSEINTNGIILCFDADTLCQPNYLKGVLSYFDQHPKRVACSIHFEHPFSDMDNGLQRDAIVNYELHLRYFIDFQRFIGIPHALQTIGSSMAVKTSAYLKEGGMNRRKAGEDFYFLHKFIKNGECGELNSVHTTPSPRESDRVPFGTGKAIGEQLKSNSEYLTYNPKSFNTLKEIINSVDRFYTNSDSSHLTESNQLFLKEQKFQLVLNSITKRSTTLERFQKHFFNWFDAFMVMRYMHWFRDHHFLNVNLTTALEELNSQSSADQGTGLEARLLELRKNHKTRGDK